MMKKLVLILAFVGSGSVAHAVNLNDLDDIVSVSYIISADADKLNRFALNVKELKDGGFEFAIGDSTQTVTITNAQKQGLLVRYNELKEKLINDINQLP